MQKLYEVFFNGIYRLIIAFAILLLNFCDSLGQVSTEIPSGSFIVNMGVTPQTIANGLKPYGMIYDLMKNYKVPVLWVINPGKVKDGVDFSYGGSDFRGGPFIIEAEYRTPVVDALIASWQSQGVVGITTTSPVDVPVFTKFFAPPRWTMDLQNGSLATIYFSNAGIPASAYGGDKTNWVLPSDLDCCDDLFVMPHADPVWETHGRLYTWNLQCKGGVWLGCHAGSALMDMWDNTTTELPPLPADPINYSEQTNFLLGKAGDVPAGFTGDYYDNALILWGDHDDGTLPYSYDHHDDPVMQFMGTIDVATQNGSEQIYIPVHDPAAAWNPTTIVGVYDPDHPDAYLYPSTPLSHVAAILAYGRGYGDDNRGYIMLEASHSVGKSTGPASVAGQRAFFNWSFLAILDKVGIPEITGIPADGILYAGETYNLDITYSGVVPSNATYVWSADCGGTFSPSPTDKNVVYTPPAVSGPVNCHITATVTDDCGRVSFDNHSVVIACEMAVSTAITAPCYGDPTGGAIEMIISGATAPFVYSWTESGGATGSGSGTTITGLAAGEYTITVTGNNGAGCTTTFSVSISASPQISATATPTHVLCNGGSTGAVDLVVSGGTPGYSYSWTGNDFAAITQNISDLAAGAYVAVITDSKGCTKSVSTIVNEPLAISLSYIATDVLCKGESTGAINITVNGGTTPFTYSWNDGNSDKDRTGLTAGTYSLTITDANGCSYTENAITVTEPALALELSETHADVLCSGDYTGSVDLTVLGGTGPYSYSWTGPLNYMSTAEDISGLLNGNYEVTVIDANGCTAILPVTIATSAGIVITSEVSQPTCPPATPANPAVSTPPLNSDGTISITVVGGSGTYTSFSWVASNGGDVTGQENNQNLTDLVAGTYTVTITDSNGCSESSTINLYYRNPNPVQPSIINY